MKKKFRLFSSNKHAVTEIIGTILLLGISIVLFSVVYLSVFSIPDQTSTPSTKIMGSLHPNEDKIVFHHLGGEPIQGNSKILVHKGEITNEALVSTFVGDLWEMGETITYKVYNINDTYIDASIIDTDSNSIVSSAVLQKGYSTTNPYVETLSAKDISKDSAKLYMNYDFVKHSGTIYFQYQKIGESSWINTPSPSVSANGYDQFSKQVTNLEMDTTYQYRAVIEYDGNTLTGNKIQFTTKSPSLQTHIDNIPDNISTSPFNITASGDADLDNVTLYYRWSKDDGATWENSSSGPNWWNAAWQNRKKFIIQGSSAGEVKEYPIAITVHYGEGVDSSHHVYLNSSCQNDFDDIRFTNEVGSVLPYYLEQKIDGDKALFWVKIDTIPVDPNNKSCYIYYDNSAATSNSDGSATFSSFEDFETIPFIFDSSGDNDGINLIQSFSNVKHGNACVTHNDNQNYRIQMQTDEQYDAEEYLFGTWARINQGWTGDDGLGPGIAFCCSPGSNQGYQIILDARNAESPQIREDADYNSREKGNFQISNNEWYYICGYKEGNIVKGSLYTEEQFYDGVPQTTTEMNSDSYNNGYHGLFVYGNSYQFWDAARVQKHVSPEPTIQSWEMSGGTGWEKYEVDEDSPWSWSFSFGEYPGYYEFVSIGQYNDEYEMWPEIADQNCTYS